MMVEMCAVIVRLTNMGVNL